MKTYKTYREQADEILGRINKAIYSYPQDILAAHTAWCDYAELLERYGNIDAFPLADKIADGYSYRAIILARGLAHRRKVDNL